MVNQGNFRPGGSSLNAVRPQGGVLVGVAVDRLKTSNDIQSNPQRTKMPNFNYIGGNIRLDRTGASGRGGEGCKQSFSFRRLADLLSMIGLERLRGSLSTWWIGYMSERHRFNNVVRAG